MVVGRDFGRKIAIRAGWRRLDDRVQTLAKLPQGWAGLESNSPSGLVVKNARTFLETLAACQFSKFPELSIEDDGELEFSWRGRSFYAAVSFSRDGHIIAFVRRDGFAPLKIDQRYLRMNHDLLESLRALIA
jgi:hypothetical protein